MLKILWKRGEIAPEEQFLLLSTIFSYLMLDFYVKTRIRFSFRDKRLFEITEVEITRVDCILTVCDLTVCQQQQQQLHKPITCNMLDIISNVLQISRTTIWIPTERMVWAGWGLVCELYMCQSVFKKNKRGFRTWSNRHKIIWCFQSWPK